jgi:hypothetical protein
MPDNNQLQPGQVTELPQSNYNLENDLGKLVDLTADVPVPSNRNLLLNNADSTGNGEKVNPLWGLYLNVMKDTPNPLSQKLLTNYDQTERYSTDKWGGYNPYDINLENLYGKNQGWFSQMGNRVMKFGAKAVGSFAGALWNIPSMIDAVKSGSIDKFWDNPVNNWTNDMNDAAEKMFPNYKTNWESEHPFLNLIPIYGNAGNGWGNVLEQAGFTVGALGGSIVEDLAVGTLTGGVGEIPLAAMQINKAVYRLGKLMGMGQEGMEALTNTIKTSDELVKGLKGIDKFNFAVRKGLWGANMITSGMSEAAFEGIESYRTLTQDLSKQFYDENGRLPSYEESQKINETARHAANTRFLLNVGLLSLTNSIQFSSLMRPFNITKELLEAEAKSGIKVALKEGSKDVFEALAPETRLAKVGNFLKNNFVSELIKDSGSEGFEEGAQFAIQNSVDDYYKRKYNEKGVDFTNNFLKSFGTGLSKTLGTQEGWENTVYGLLGGVLFDLGKQGYQKARGVEAPSHHEELKTVIAGLNSESLTGIFENKYAEAVTAASIQKDISDAAKKGDMFAYKNYKHDMFVNFVYSGIKQNKFDTRIEQLESLKSVDEKEFRQLFGIPVTEESKRNVNAFVDKMIDNANFINDVSKRVNRTFVNPFKYKGTGNFKNKEEADKQEEVNKNYHAYEGVKETLVKLMGKNRDSAQRIGELRDQMSSFDSPINTDTAIKLTSTEGLKNLKQEYKDALKDGEETLKLRKDPKVAKQVDWYMDRIAELDKIHSSEDEKETSKTYNKLLNEVYKKGIEDRESLIKQGDSVPMFTKNDYHEMLDLGGDINNLHARSKAAVAAYATLTTKDGFKKAFNRVKDLREEAANVSVNVEDEKPKADLGQDEALAILQNNPDDLNPSNNPPQPVNNKKEAQVPAAPAAPNVQMEESQTAIPDTQKVRLNDTVAKIVDGKYQANGDEMVYLGFKTEHELKFDDPNVNLDDYDVATDNAGMKYYIPKSVVKNARIIAARGAEVIENNPTGRFENITPENKIQDPSDPGNNPPDDGGDNPVSGGGMYMQDFLAKIFVPTGKKGPDLRPFFNRAIFSGTPQQVRQALSIVVRPLSAELQAAHDGQKSGNIPYSNYEGFPGVYTSNAPIDLSVYHETTQIGYISNPERLLFKVGNSFVTMDKLTPQQYAHFTRRPITAYEADLEEYQKQVAFKNFLAYKYKENNYQPVTITPQELSDYLDISVKYGQLDIVKNDDARPLYRNLVRNTVTARDAQGNPHQIIAIVSAKRSFGTNETRRTDVPNFIYSSNVYQLNLDTSHIEQYVLSNPSIIQKTNSRYIGLIEMPDGTYRNVALRASTMADGAKEQLLNDIKAQSADTHQNAVHRVASEDLADYTIITGNNERQYFAINNEAAKEYNNEFNTQLENRLFVSDPNMNLWFNISVSPIGALRLDVFDPKSEYGKVVYLSHQRLASVRTFPDFVKALQEQVAIASKNDAEFAKRKVTILDTSFKQNLADDEDMRDKGEQAAAALSAATSANITENPRMLLVPNRTTLTQANTQISQRLRESAASEQQAAPTEEAKQGEQIVNETISPVHHAPQIGTISSLGQVDEQGHPIPIDVTPSTSAAQENLSDIMFPSLPEALAAVGIRFMNDPEGIIYLSTTDNSRLDNFKGMTPTEVAKSFNLQWQTQKPTTTDDFEFKLGEHNGIQDLNRMMNVEQAKLYIQSRLPSFIKIDDVNNILDKISVDGKVYGAFSNGVIYLNSDAPAGTEYHEAFHGVFRMLLSEKEIDNYLQKAQEDLYSKLKKEGKTIREALKEKRDVGLYKNLSDKEAYDRLYEEHMADKYQTWKLQRENAGFFQKLFDKIRAFFNWITRNRTDLDALFYNIDSGVYRYSNIAANRFTQQTNDETGLPEIAFALIPARPGRREITTGNYVTVNRMLDAKTSKQVVQSVAAYYDMYRQFKENIGKKDEQLLNIILDDLKARYDVNNPEYASWTEEQKAGLASSDNSFIYSNEESRNLIKEGAKKYINTLKYIEQFFQNTNEEEVDEDVENSEMGGNQPSTGFDNRAENKGGFTSLPKILREFIGFSTYNTTDEFGNENIKDGVPVIGTVDSLAVYYGLLRSLANITDPVRFFQKMQLYATNNEQARVFVSKLNKEIGLDLNALMDENRIEATGNTALLQMTINGFNKFRIDYVFTEHDIQRQVSRTYAANRRNVERVQFDSWSNNFINTYAKYDADTQRRIRQDLIGMRNRWFDVKRSRILSDAELDTAIGEVKQVFENVGVQLSRDYLRYSILSLRAKEFEKLDATYKTQGTDLQYDNPQNIYVTKQQHQFTDVMKIPEEQALTYDFFEVLSTGVLGGNNNPFYKTHTETGDEIDTAMIGRLLNIAKGNAQFDETVGESSFMNAAGKLVFAHQDGTYNVKETYNLRDTNYRKRLRETGVREQTTAYRDAYDAEWLTKNYLLNSDPFEKVADNLGFVRIDGMRGVDINSIGRVVTQEFRDQKEGVTYGDYSPREFIVNLMNMYVSYARKQRGTDGREYVVAPHLIRVLEASKTGDAVLLPINTNVYTNGSVTQKSVDIIYGEVKKEYDRIRRVANEISNPDIAKVENYHNGSFADDGYTITKGYRGLQFTDNMTPHLKGLAAQLERKARNGEELSEADVAQIKSSVAESLNDMVTNTLEVLEREGIIRKTPRAGVYQNVLLYNGTVAEEGQTQAQRNANQSKGFMSGHELTGLKNSARNASFFADNIGHVVINDYINTLAYNQILHGDSALGLKNDGGIDAVKRAKGDNAAIVSIAAHVTNPALGITEEFTHSRVAVFTEPRSWSDVIRKNIDIADAQMYSTVKSLRYTLWGLGRLSPRLASFLDALEIGDNIHNMRVPLKNEDGTPQVDDRGRQKYSQPFDGVFDNDNGILKYDEMTNSMKLVYKDGHSYFKMSVVVLQPNLTSYKNSKGEWVSRPGWETLHNLRTKMENDGIHFAAPQSASKMMTLDVARDINEFSDLKGHLFNNDYFGLQTENPSNKREITTPTQLLQLIDNEQDDDAQVYFDGQHGVRIGDLKTAYQNYVAQRVSNAYNVTRQEVYKIEDLNKDVEQSIKDGQVTPELANFQRRAVEQLEATGADAQLVDFFSLDENGNPKYDLNLSATKTKFAQLYLSYFSKGILSQKSPGYTVALMSGMDTKFIKRATRVENGRVVSWDVIRREQWDSNYGRVQGEYIFPHKDHVSEEGQLFLGELEYNVPEYDQDGKIKGYYSEMVLPPHFRDFLDIAISDEELPEAISKGLGVRIPSQDKHSFMSLKIVDFLPANLGSTAMFPKELIGLSGADFDIDKEYINRYDFYTTRDERGNVSFHKYGEARTNEEKWEEYKQWMANSNKTIKNAIKDISMGNERYKKLADRESNESAAADILGQRESLLKKLMDGIITSALAKNGQPSTLEEFIERSRSGELNNGVLSNKIVDSFISLLTNQAMHDIAKTPATLTALQQIKDRPEMFLKDANNNPIGESIFGKGKQHPVDSLVGKYSAFKNNTTGKNNIGIDVNANLIYSVLNKGNVSLRPSVEAFRFDGQVYNSFSGNKQFNLESVDNPNIEAFSGIRTNDLFSTLITAATDEAKEQLNALYNLSVDALKIVDYLTALKVPIETSIYLVNQPAIRNYLQLKAVKQNTIQTKDEEQTPKSQYQQKAMEMTKEQIKDYDKMNDSDLLDMFERGGLFRKEC